MTPMISLLIRSTSFPKSSLLNPPACMLRTSVKERHHYFLVRTIDRLDAHANAVAYAQTCSIRQPVIRPFLCTTQVQHGPKLGVDPNYLGAQDFLAGEEWERVPVPNGASREPR